MNTTNVFLLGGKVANGRIHKASKRFRKNINNEKNDLQ